MQVVKDSTDVTTYFVLRDSTNHAPKTDVTITDIDLYYVPHKGAMATKVDATALAAADSAHADNKAFHVGLGEYRIDWPDIWTGAVGTSVQLIVVCTGVDTTFLEVEITADVAAIKDKTDDLTFTVAGDLDVNVQTWKGSAAPDIAGEADIAGAVLDEALGTHTGFLATVLPNAAPGANGGLPTTDGTKLNQTATLANGAHGGAAATMTLKSVAVNNGDANGIGVSVTGSGTGNSHALYLNSTNGQGLCVVAGSHAVTATSSAGKGMEIIGATGDVVADITGNLSGSIGSVGTAGIAAASYAAGAVDAAALAADASQEIADTTLARSLAAESYAADGAVPTLSQMLYGIWSALAQFDIAATTITCRKLDGTTSAMTFTLNDAANPTSRTRAT